MADGNDEDSGNAAVAHDDPPPPPPPPTYPHRELDVSQWNRKAVFDLYNNGPSPQWGITIRLDVTQLRRVCHLNEWSYLQGSLFLLAKTVNQYEPMRYRIREHNQVVIPQVVHPSITILRKDETYGFCFFQATETFSEFRDYAKAALTHFHANSQGLDGNRRDDALHGSVLPWLDFTSYEHALGNFAMPTSIPRYCFGKLVPSSARGPGEEQWSQAFCLHVHHGLMDGLHMGRFMQLFQQNLDRAEELMKD